MAKDLDPLIHEFDTVEEAEAYDKWFRAEIDASLEDARPSIPHDRVLADMEALISAKRKTRNDR
ncbi:antitoxin [Caballeronia sp. LP006]|uniref:type II toxin-antitoxin system RelB family antitoxin n=1 Tax=Caballeronia sp. LP006 TaxID=3038552 RepID=UPI00285DA54A|nr:antitoxin [Caballeronia sp. LP006]MDR5830078.1 antitoxin [Caballeronia sp. LP006]